MRSVSSQGVVSTKEASRQYHAHAAYSNHWTGPCGQNHIPNTENKSANKLLLDKSAPQIKRYGLEQVCLHSSANLEE